MAALFASLPPELAAVICAHLASCDSPLAVARLHHALGCAAAPRAALLAAKDALARRCERTCFAAELRAAVGETTCCHSWARSIEHYSNCVASAAVDEAVLASMPLREHTLFFNSDTDSTWGWSLPDWTGSTDASTDSDWWTDSDAEFDTQFDTHSAGGSVSDTAGGGGGGGGGAVDTSSSDASLVDAEMRRGRAQETSRDGGSVDLFAGAGTREAWQRCQGHAVSGGFSVHALADKLEAIAIGAGSAHSSHGLAGLGFSWHSSQHSRLESGAWTGGQWALSEDETVFFSASDDLSPPFDDGVALGDSDSSDSESEAASDAGSSDSEASSEDGCDGQSAVSSASDRSAGDSFSIPGCLSEGGSWRHSIDGSDGGESWSIDSGYDAFEDDNDDALSFGDDADCYFD